MSPAVLLSSRSYGELKRYILERTGLSYYQDRDEDLAARISRRLTARDLADAGAYLRLLDRDSEEVDSLVGELTIGETYFFRQPEHFDLLRRTILPNILERKRPSRQLRIWSAGCATGAEPYSLAILLSLEFQDAIAGWDVSILATDLNTEFLTAAREGLFGSWALRETPPEIKARCFREEGKKWRLLPEFRNRVTFHYHNLVSSDHPSPDELPFDLILCRNVLIYFSKPTIRAVTGRLFEYLERGGWLLVGHAEPNPETFAIFETVTGPAATAYRRNEDRIFPSHLHFPSPVPAEQRTETPGLPFAPVKWELDNLPPRSRAIARPEIAAGAPTLPVEDVRLLADRGNWDRARNAADQLVRHDPLNAPAHFTLGLILEHTEEYEAAREAQRRAIYLDRGFALAHYHLGTLSHLTGDTASANRSFTTVLRLVNLKSPAEQLPHGDGITAAELGELAKMHLELIAK